MRRSAWLFAGSLLVATTMFGGDGNVHRNARHIPGRYIVVLSPTADTASVATSVRSANGGRVHHTYERSFKGLAVEISDADAQALARDSRVQFVEEDATVSIASGPSWGQDRIDQRALPLDGAYVNSGTGAGVTLYIVDTGVFSGHSEFGGRVAAGFTAFADNNGTEDCNGHGTHVAGIAAGAIYGVATSATIVPVRVLDCTGSGTLSDVLSGLDWVLQDHASSTTPAVVNMSLAGNISTTLDNEVNNLLAAGITTVVAAGNDASDACAKSPARVPGALTVGASNDRDEQASWSNFGSCVDLFAPGSNIPAAWYGSANSISVSSGTSESAPYVAGVAALVLEKYPTASPATVAQTVVSQATIDALSNVTAGTANRLLFALIDALADMSGDTQLLADPGFEYGITFWSADICTVINQTGCPPGEFPDIFEILSIGAHSGKSHATIGGPARTFHLVSENVTVPSSARKAELTAYIWISTKVHKQAAQDVLAVEIRDASGALLATLGTFSNLDANATYTQQRFDISQFRGRTIRVSFTGTQGKGAPTYFLIDDVNLTISR